MTAIARVGLLTTASMVVSSVARPIVKPVADVITGTLGLVGDTVTTVYKTAHYGNVSIQRAADFAEINNHSRDQMKRMTLQSTQREALISYGESTDALKERYNALNEQTRELVDSRENRFRTP